MTDYKLTQVCNDSLSILQSTEYGTQLWVLGKYIRKRHLCCQCRTEVAIGNRMFRPITNLQNRMDRMCQWCMARLHQAAMEKYIPQDETQND